MKVKPADRPALLEHARALKMARSVHAFVRGNTARFYDWLAELPIASAIPAGPSIWICGDCHLGNLGPLADNERDVDIQIRDLDQTVIGNPAHDLIRLGLSLVTAARSSELPGVATARMIEAMLAGYRRAIGPNDGDDDAHAVEPDVVRTVRKRATGRRWQHLARERIGDAAPTIPLGKTFWMLSKDERAAIEALFEDDAIRDRVLELAGLGHKGRIRLIDAAYWKKGCSSLGYLRYAVLLGASEKGDKDEALALVDIKEAVASVAPTTNATAMPRDEAQRVVAGACALSPNLGERMIAATLLSRPVVMRELAPQDLKLEIDQFSRGEAVHAATYLAYVVGRAHARQMGEASRREWHAALGDRATPDLDTPSWLWQSVVELAGRHETAYLEHCRDYAIASDRG